MNLFFWQPKKNWLKFFTSIKYGSQFIVFLNYVIWIFLFYISYLLIKNSTNTFWQIFFATFIAEFIEKFLKIKNLWLRPLSQRGDKIPAGLITSWYQKGSFPSGHAIKIAYFTLFLIQYSNLFSVPLFLLLSLPPVLIRIPLGFHYPIDFFGGLIFGVLIWIFAHQIVMPAHLTEIIHVIFNFIFLIK